MKSYIFDNNGTTLDRFTFIMPNGEVFGSSLNPFEGVGCVCGNVTYLNGFNFKNLQRKDIIRHKKMYVNWIKKVEKQITEDELNKISPDAYDWFTQLSKENKL